MVGRNPVIIKLVTPPNEEGLHCSQDDGQIEEEEES